MRIYIDSDILIWHLRGEKKALEFLQEVRDLKKDELWIGAMQRAEITFFMKPREEEETLLFLSQFKTANIDQNCVDLAATLYRYWHPSHGIDVNDAFLAATVVSTGGQIYCLNTKHYPMPEVVSQRPW